MGDLNVDNMMTEDELGSLFTSTDDEDLDDILDDEDPKDDKEEKTVEEEIDVEDLFTSESVGSKSQEEGKVPSSEQEKGSSPTNTNFYSSIANACKEEGIFPDLDEEFLSTVNDAESFKEALSKQVEAMLTERQKRIDEALEYGVEPEEVQKYQKALDWLDSIKEDSLREEGDSGDKLRRDLIFNDFLNRGLSREKAQRLTQLAFDNGTDIEDAIEALNSNKKTIKEKYDSIIEDAKQQALEEEENDRKQAETLKKEILSNDEPFKGIKIDQSTKQKVFEAITKPIYTDKDGNKFTAIQKAQMDDNIGFIKNLGYLYVLTNGFKDLDTVVKSKVNKETKRGFRAIEDALRNSGFQGGELKFASGVDAEDDRDSKGLLIDL